jgi:arylformamidase
MSEYIDISMPIHEGMTHWPTDPAVRIETVKSPETGDRSTVSMLHFGSHTGTHVDAPRHYLEDGTGVDELPLERLIGPCQVMDCRGRDSISVRMIESARLKDVSRILFRTDNSQGNAAMMFSERYAALEPDAARLLVERGAVLVGVDGLSVDPYDSRTPAAHTELLRAGVIIVEGLNMHDVPAGRYEIICLPLRIRKGDGAPARVVLRRLERDDHVQGRT